MAFQAVVFDLDGTLLDTEELAYQAAQEVYGAYGLTFTQDHFAAVAGTTPQFTLDTMKQAFPEIDGDQAFEEWDNRLGELFEQDIPLRPTAEVLLSALEAQHIPFAIATSSSKKGAHRKLEVTGLADRFSVVVTIDDVTAPKPAPEPYLLAAKGLGVDPSACLAFEDSDTGAASAKAAGMTVVQVPDVGPIKGDSANIVASTLMQGAIGAGLIAAETV